MHEVHDKQSLIVHWGLCCKGNTKGAAPKAAVGVRETLSHPLNDRELLKGWRDVSHVSFHLAQFRNIRNDEQVSLG